MWLLYVQKKWLVQTVPKYNIRETRSNGDIKCINHMHKLCIFSMKQCCIQVTVMLLKKKKKGKMLHGSLGMEAQGLSAFEVETVFLKASEMFVSQPFSLSLTLRGKCCCRFLWRVLI